MTAQTAPLRRPLSLRSTLAAGSIGLASVTAAPVQAQDDTIILPAITVEATADPLIKKRRRAAVAQPVTQPTATPTEPVTTAPVAGATPYTDPTAPYAAVTSGNSRLGQPLLDTARSVTAIPRQVLEDKQATSVRELARTTPGITLGTGEGGNAFGDVLFIRGFRASNDTFIDGIRDGGVALRETFMAEQAEITKGPSGSIAGRGTTGGAVNLVTKKPLDHDATEVTVGTGTDMAGRVTLDWNKVYSPRLRTRLNAMKQEGNIAGRNGVYDDRKGLSFAADYALTETVTLSADLYHLEMDQMPDWGVPWDSVNGVPMTEAAAGRPTLPRDTFYGVTDRDYQTGTQDLATVGAAWKIAPDLTLTSRLRAGQTVNDYIATAPERPVLTNVDPDLWTLTASPKSRYQVNDILANQTELAWKFQTGAVKHALVAGLEWSDESISQQGYQGIASENGGGTAAANLTGCSVTIFDPDTSGCFDPATTDLILGTATLTDVTSRSAYVIDTVTWGNWQANAGLRFDDYAISRSGIRNDAPYLYERSDSFVNWNLGLTWKPAPNASVYFAGATSTNPMGQELDAGGGDYGGLDAAGVLLDPEENRSLELGAKWKPGRVMFTAALFQTDKDKARETVAGVTDDTGRYRVRGLEIGAQGSLTDRLSLFAGATVMDSEILASANPDAIGHDFANIAHQQANLLLKYRVSDKWTLGGQVTWRGEIKGGTFAADLGTNQNRLPGYTRIDALAEYAVTDRATLNLTVQNLTDATYYDAFYRSGAPYVYVAPGRSATLTLKMTF